METFPIEQQLAAACDCNLSLPEAARMLGVDRALPTYSAHLLIYVILRSLGIDKPSFMASKYDCSRFRERFTFDNAQVLAYIRSRPSLARRIQSNAEDQRIDAGPFLLERDGRYEVGLFGKQGFSQIKRFKQLDEAAADFIWLWWGFPREGPFEAPADARPWST